jgi:hypothetical protein
VEFQTETTPIKAAFNLLLSLEIKKPQLITAAIYSFELYFLLFSSFLGPSPAFSSTGLFLAPYAFLVH